jgi:hypothetical protein
MQIWYEYTFMWILDEFFLMQIWYEYTFMWILDEIFLMQIPYQYTFMWNLDEFLFSANSGQIYIFMQFENHQHRGSSSMKTVDYNS